MKSFYQLDKKKAFTVVELVVALVLVGILVVFGIPKFANLRVESIEAEEDAVFATIQEAIEMKSAQNMMEFIDNSDGHPHPDVDPFTLLDQGPPFEPSWDNTPLIGKWKACRDAGNTAWQMFCPHYDGVCGGGGGPTVGRMWVYVWGNDAVGSGLAAENPGGTALHADWGH